jgi:PqqD family protein of HPr-rel-A system
MRPASGMHVEWVEDEAVVLDQGSGRVHYLNSSAALVYALIQERGYDDAIAELERRHVDVPDLREQVAAAVHDMVAQGLLVDD